MRREGGSDSGSESSEEEVINFKRCKRSSKESSASSLVVDVPDAKVELVKSATAKPVSLLPSKVAESSKPDSTATRDNLLEFPVGRGFNRSWEDTIYETLTDGEKDESGDEIKFASCLENQTGRRDQLKLMGFGKGIRASQLRPEVSEMRLKQINKLLSDAGIVIDRTYVTQKQDISVEEEIEWLQADFAKPPYAYPTMADWRKVGPRKTGILGEIDFIDADLLQNLFVLKKCRNVLTAADRQQIRARCNPFEGVGKGPFISRGGLKLANLDAICSFALTQPSPDLKADNELLYFADVCGGPGGYTEYILFRRNWGAKGFGMSMKLDGLDFNVDCFNMANAESFEPFYGPAGDGNVYNHDNTNAFINLAFSCQDEELEEILHAQLYVSQCMLALALVKPGGIFVCKFFDTLTPFTVGLVYLMYCSFERVAIHKPNSSRPDNSERFLICKGKKSGTDGILTYLTACHFLFWSWTQEGSRETWKEDVVELVPSDVINRDSKFFDYMVETNSRIARKQIKALELMLVCAKDPLLEDSRKGWIAKKCLEYWKIPGTKNIPQRWFGVRKYFKHLLGSQSIEFLKSHDFVLTEQNLEAFIRSPFDWRMVVVEAESQDTNRGFYFAMGQNRLYRMDGEKWTRSNEKVDLSPGTLVYGEFVNEIHGKNASQPIQRALYIIDALILGGTNIATLHYMQRIQDCARFAQSMTKLTKPEWCVVRVKPAVRVENISDIFAKLGNQQVSGCSGAQLVSPVDIRNPSSPVIKPAGILFLKITKDPWTMALSRSANRKYYFNLATGVSSFNVPPEAISGFEYTMEHRLSWTWNKEVKTILATQNVLDETRTISTSPGVFNPQNLLRLVARSLQSN
ncbi:Cap-specific mRNA (nucleoside-2'-O-)-methyltransferase 1 [Orchesella cincta]|uniref:Cap-specific mRNA (nucleoside-2'-O-)-methyltransferase 1 n=1 Tax=Orchesella cincta TaxID=48709 RepID=A0A1D2MU14_ORCCI|nr:Cap-specific mRNA (nucleoside-2'-O-)-methyltransferase 1 [Orchesella cincta]